jgi:uncharacterized protein YraI
LASFAKLAVFGLKRAAIFLGFLAGLWLGTLGLAKAEPRIALVIGNSDYRLVPALPNPVNDAILIARTLEGLGFTVTLQQNSDRQSTATAIRDFGKALKVAGRDAVGLFFYAGHAVQAGGQNYLIPLAAPVESEADLEIYAVKASWVVRQMRDADNDFNMIILDACRNNPFEGAFRSVDGGLTRMQAPSGSLVAYSAAPGQVAYDGEGANSAYSAALATTMGLPGLKVEDVFKRVRVAVEAATNGSQTPWEESSLRGDFYFNPVGLAATGVAEAGAKQEAATADKEVVFWNSIENSGDPAMFEAYLARFPEGIFRGLAELKIDALRAGSPAPPTAALEATASAPPWAVIPLSGAFEARKTANLRAGPGTGFARVGRLKEGSPAIVTGRVEGKDWYRIALADGGHAYVFGPLIVARASPPSQPAQPATQAATTPSYYPGTDTAEPSATRISVPQLIGYSVQAARKRLGNAGFTGPISVVSGDCGRRSIAPGKVCDYSPYGGDRHPPDVAFEFVVQSGSGNQ